jgi:membrane protease subunit (stomatin/prohibitin family)
MSKYMLAVAALAVGALSMSSALRAQDKDNPHPKGGMMGMDSGMMNMMGQMGRMMEECNQMMQSSSAKPNEQWKGGTPEPNDKGDKKQ